MKRLSETAEMSGMANDFSTWLLDVLSSTPPVSNAEIIRHPGHFRSLAKALHE